MKKELDTALVADFPKIFANRYGDMRTTAMCWGFECDDGWEPLIRDLCTKLQKISDWEEHQVVALQVKEKFGELRFYIHGGTDIQWAVIEQAESRSTSTCEICGQRGSTRSDRGWLKTLCPKHAHENGYWLYDFEAEKLGLKKGEYIDKDDLDKEDS